MEPDYLAYARKLLERLVEIPTPNPPGENYEEAARLLGEELEKLGFSVEYIEVPEEYLDEHYPYKPLHRGKKRLIVYAKLVGDEEAARYNILQFNGHYDVVPPGEGWSGNPYRVWEDGGCLYGRGTSDMKAGIAAALAAMKAYLDEGNTPRGALEAVFVPDEETGGIGTKYFLEKTGSEPSYVVIGEPTWRERVVVGHRGLLRGKIYVYGRQVHGSMPWRGENAFLHAARLALELVKRYTPVLLSRRMGMPVDSPDPQAVYPSLNLGGYAESLTRKENSVPGVFVFSVDRRIIPEEDPERVAEELREIVEETARSIGVRAEPRIEHVIPPAVSPTDSPLVEAFRDCAWSEAGVKVEAAVSLIRSDATYYIRRGAHAVNYGPGDPEKAHVPDECVSLERLEETIRVYTCVLKKILGFKQKTLE